LKDREIAIKIINTSLEKKNWEDKQNFLIEGQNWKQIKLTNESKKIKKQRIPISNKLNDDGWNFLKIIKNNWS
jgi:hypothetical protein